MKTFLVIVLLLVNQLIFAQKNLPILYKIVQNTDNNSNQTERTYLISINQIPGKNNKEKLMEMKIESIEETDLKKKSLNYSNLKIENMDNFMNSSSSLEYLLMNYLPIQFTIQKTGIALDSIAFMDNFNKKIDEYKIDGNVLGYYKTNFFKLYKSLLDDIYFYDLSTLNKEDLKKNQINKSEFSYLINNKSKNYWKVEKTKDVKPFVSQTIVFNPKSMLVDSTLKIFEDTFEHQGNTYNYKQQSTIKRIKEINISKPTNTYYEMVLKGNPWSNYFKDKKDVDSIMFAKYVDEYKEEFALDPFYSKSVLSALLNANKYDEYHIILAKTPSKFLINSHHIINKAMNAEMGSEDFIETITLLTNEQLYNYVQTSLSQHINANSEKELEKMNLLFSKGTDREKTALNPMVIWSTYKNSKDNQTIQKGIDELHKLEDISWKEANVARYIILLAQQQFKNERSDLNEYLKIKKRLEQLVDNEKYKNQLINKAHLAHVNFSLFEALKMNKSEEAFAYLKEANLLSPKNSSEYDYQSNYDRFFTNSKKSYLDDYLSELNKREGKDVVLNQYITEYVKDPGRNYAMIKKFYHENYDKAEFANFLNRDAFSKLESAPAFLLKDLVGNDISPSQYKGKWILIDFWGTWCGPCVAELPEFNKDYEKKYLSKSDKLQVLTIACYDEESSVKKFMAKNKYSFPVLMSDGKVNQNYKIKGYPTKIIITPEGKLITMEFGQDWKGFLDEMLSI